MRRCCSLLPADALEARTRKGDKLLKLGSAAEARKEYDKALDYYQQALNQDPQDTIYQLGARRVRFQAGQAHVEAGMKLRTGRQTGTGAGGVPKGVQRSIRVR